jgi:hypothetical protein
MTRITISVGCGKSFFHISLSMCSMLDVLKREKGEVGVIRERLQKEFKK